MYKVNLANTKPKRKEKRMKAKVIVDSTFNLEPDFIVENDIDVIPLNVIIDGTTYQDGIDIQFDEVMKAFDEGSKVSTSQPSPGLFIEYFEKAKTEGATDVLCMTISSTLSGTYQSAFLAKQEVEGINIHLVDTLSTAIGAEILALIAIKHLKENMAIADIVAKIDQIKHQSGIFMNMENLTSLRKSGRISRIKATIGNLLRVKPVIEFFNGKVEINSKFRTDAHVAEWITNRIKQAFDGVTSKLHIFVAYVRDPERIEKVLDLLKATFPKLNIKVRNGITPVIAVNLGYGGFGVAWSYE